MPEAPRGRALGVIAGAGLMPIRLADAGVKTGRPVVCVLVEGFADAADYQRFPHEVIPLGQIGRMLALLRAHGVQDLVMGGRITRPSLSTFRFDGEGVRLLGKLGTRALFGGDDRLLTAVLRVAREEGFEPLMAQDLLSDLMVPEGLLAGPAPDALARADIRRGIRVAQALGLADVGQCCVVQQGLVLGVEGVDGTDALLARCAGLRREGPGGVLVKLVKPMQDRRIDMPVIGPDTVRNAAAAGLRGIAVEAAEQFHGTLVLERAETEAAAAAAGMFLLAVRPAAFLASEGDEA